MNKHSYLFSFFLLLFLSSTSFSQLSEKAYIWGGGLSYPRFVNVDTSPLEVNFGATIFIQKNFTENSGLRLSGKYNYLQTDWSGSSGNTSATSAFSGNLDFLYYIAPCQTVNPYFTAGFGLIYFSTDNPKTASLNGDSFLDYQLNLGFGSEWVLTPVLNLTTELSYHTLPTSKFDGSYSANQTSGFLGGSYDTYMSFSVGVAYYFEKGKPSTKCDLYSGIREALESMNLATKDDVEKIVKKYIPKEVVKEVVIEKPVQNGNYTTYSPSNNWVLVGVNFDVNSARLKPESIPVLLHATQILLQNPDLEVEIAGYTDNIGTHRQNKTMSEKRAKVVKHYLMSRGIKGNRLKAVGYGEANPIGTNRTHEGRAMNRRIEFKIIKN